MLIELCCWLFESHKNQQNFCKTKHQENQIAVITEQENSKMCVCNY